MNDFTKKDLEVILEGVSWWLEGYSDFYSEHLIIKIQTMIDNYCENQYENDFGRDSRTKLEKSINPMCKKCGKYY